MNKHPGFSTKESIDLVSLFLKKPVDEKKWAAVRAYISLDTRVVPAMKHKNYSNSEYLLGAAACYVDYSKSYFKVFDRVYSQLPKISSALELGAGCGLTTAHLAQILPQAKIIYNNLPSVQYDFAKWLFKQRGIAGRVSQTADMFSVKKHVDLVVATDFFEHVKTPTEWIEKIIDNTSPKVMLVANAFNLPHPDHLEYFYDRGTKTHFSKVSRSWNKAVRDKGYELHPVVKTFWNRRPAIWVKTR